MSSSGPVSIRFRDIFKSYITPWLADRLDPNAGQDQPGPSILNAGYRYLWTMIAPLDAAAENLVQSLQAAWPGIGTPTALPLIERMRGIVRGEGESDDAYVARAKTWLDQWRAAGSAEGIALAIQQYLSAHPQIRIVTRSGYWVTLHTDGTIVTQQGTWNWDGTSNPERAGFWSEIWIIIYPSPWSDSGSFLNTGLKWGGDGLGVGHDVDRVEYDAVQGLIAQWKSAHTKIRAVVWTTDGTLFDPNTPASLPDGTWGGWGGTGSGSRTRSGRNYTTCRYWEPR